MVLTAIPKRADDLIHRAVDVDQVIILEIGEMSERTTDGEMRRNLERISDLARKNADILQRAAH